METKTPRKRFIGGKHTNQTSNLSGKSSNDLVKSSNNGINRFRNPIPLEILENQDLNMAISLLPSNYNFEIHKTVYNIQKFKATKVALQMPEGLLIYACTISDILEKFCHVETLIMGDVTYGACCIDDFTARALGCDFMVHYGHSCLIPVDITTIKTLYVFVEITINSKHISETIKTTFSSGTKIALVSTVQFISALSNIQSLLKSDYQIIIPQSKPLSPGEILGCTSPIFNSDILIYIGDGRFHLESAMIANPNLPAYKYDPYSTKFTKEEYDHNEMRSLRTNAIKTARKEYLKWGLIVGTLGRQGSSIVMENIKKSLEISKKSYIIVLMTEIFPDRLAQFTDIDVWVQIACPRLSIDWGYAFSTPLLSPYEAIIALSNDDHEWMKDSENIKTASYPMDFYANNSLGPWTPNHGRSIKKTRQLTSTNSKPIIIG